MDYIILIKLFIQIKKTFGEADFSAGVAQTSFQFNPNLFCRVENCGVRFFHAPLSQTCHPQDLNKSQDNKLTTFFGLLSGPEVRLVDGIVCRPKMGAEHLLEVIFFFILLLHFSF